MGSSRGFFIGQLVDDLSAISAQVKTRNLLGLTDLTKVLEDFFKEVLNAACGYNLVNLNQTRSNEPGLDLGDTTARVAFQITSTATLAKVHKTLEKLTVPQKAAYDEINILIIGQKQGSYALDPTIVGTLPFTVANIWDVTDLCRRAIGLDIGRLQSLQQLVANEQARVRIELEPRLADGTHQTTIDDFVEAVPEVVRSDATLFFANEQVEGLLGDVEAARTSLDALIDGLLTLPRITREFYGLLLAKALPGFDGDHLVVNDDWLRRTVHLNDLDGELRLLSEGGFVWFDEPQEWNQSPKWRIRFPDAGRYFTEAFVSFVEDTKLSAKSLILTMNFAPFGPPPTPPA